MGRSNVIIVGVVVLAPLILGIESYALFRAHHRRVVHVAEAPPEELPTPSPSAMVPAPPPPVQPAPALTDEVAAAVAEPVPETPPPSSLQDRGEIIRAADELAFDILDLPDDQRAAIRAIDEAYARAALAANPLALWSVEQSRRTAITSLLGPAAAHTFNLAARKAKRRVRSQVGSQNGGPR
jgi:hypothetical protein